MSPIDLLLKIVDQAYDKKAWHGTNLRGSLRGVGVEEALWRPAAERHNIWELVVHATYWKYVVHRRLSDLKRGSFPLAGSNWFPRAEADAKAWKEDVALLAETHRSLRAAITDVAAQDLGNTPMKGETTIADLIHGVAAHDVYHAGQIQLIKRLYQQRDQAS